VSALNRALNSLHGLWLGDAFGGHFEFEAVDWDRPKRAALQRRLPNPVWRFTDDTQMALSVYDTLRHDGEIQPDKLASSFAQHFDISRGYGSAAEKLLWDIQAGGEWNALSSAMFGGMGSYGNGSAMRVAPLGAYFAEDTQKLIENARNSSIPTHTHPDGIAGAIAVALAAGQAALFALSDTKPEPEKFWASLLTNVPDGELAKRLAIAASLDIKQSTALAAKRLGCGWDVSAVDTVPFALWVAIKHINNFEEALWQTISVGGDADTTGAIVGGIVASYGGKACLPEVWIKRCEPLPTWAFD
jgi:ADP-ribosylglycohydrolase